METKGQKTGDNTLMNMLIAGGGTGGHLFPGIAIAESFLAGDADNKVLFVGTGRPFEKAVLSEKGFRHESISAEGLKGRGLKNQFKSMLKLPWGIFESVQIIRRFRPDMVLGVGGYSAGPVALAAWFLGIKIVLHEQNILPGITNRILSRFAGLVCVSLQDTKISLSPEKLRVTGNPVRKEILEAQSGQRISDAFTILILGGSQGATAINTAVAEALPHLGDKNRFFFVHQTGAEDEARIREAYEKYGIPCMIQAFFKDMGRVYGQADMIICRAGATTLAEVTAIGKAVIFIPYPFAADNHQVLNAQTLTSRDAAEMILQKDLSGKGLAERIEACASEPEALDKMASRAKQLGRPDAAETIVTNCYELINRN